MQLITDTIEPDEGLDVFREGEEIENLDAAKDQMTRSLEMFEVRNQALETAGEVDDASRRRLGEGRAERFVQPAARGIDENEIGVGQRVESLTRRARQDRRTRVFVFGSRRESEFEAAQSLGAAFVEADRPAMAEQSEADRADTAIVFGDRRIRWDQVRDSLDRPFEEREMVLAEGTGRKKDADISNRLHRRGLARKADHRGTENRIAAIGLSVEEETLKPVAETAFDGLRQVPQDVGGDAASHQDDLYPIG